MDTLDTFDPLVAEHSLLHHPFYVRWSRGELTQDELRIYAKEYYHLARSVPRMVERIRVRAIERQPDLVPQIEDNLREETEHVELWERFYNLSSEDAHCYFDAHLGEEAHLRVWRAVVVDSGRGRDAVLRSITAQNRVLDGVCEAAGIPLHC